MTFTLQALKSDEATASVEDASHIIVQKEIVPAADESHKECISQNCVFVGHVPLSFYKQFRYETWAIFY